jgi:glucose uptake protein GlcU
MVRAIGSARTGATTLDDQHATSPAFAAVAFVIGGGHLDLGWRASWLPLCGGVLWTTGSFAAFRATESIGLARAAGAWTPLNILVAFALGGPAIW